MSPSASSRAWRDDLVAYLFATRVTLGSFATLLKALVRAPRLRAPALTGPAAPPTREFSLINEPGFGDRWNSFTWSMQWWRGGLYVGTARAFVCLEYLALHRALPFLQRYPPRFDGDVQCTARPEDLPLRGEIWRYSPGEAQWERIYQSPLDVPLPGRPDHMMPRDIGYRGMTLFTEPDGTEALYVSGVSPRTVHPDLPPPRLLRCTDGRTFEAVPQDAGTVMGSLDAVGFRTLAVHDGRLFASAANLYGDGILFEARHPAGGNDHFRQVSPDGMRIFEMTPFQGSLYVGTRDRLHGYAVVKTDAGGSDRHVFRPVVTSGASRKGYPSHTVLGMHVFKDRLYVGTEFPGEMIRVNPDDTWDLVVGNPRRTAQGMKRPLTGLGDGFGYGLNVGIGPLQEHRGWLYVGTADLTRLFRKLPVVGRRLSAQTGFDLYATQDGVNYSTITRSGFADEASARARTLASTPVGLFFGANNPRVGAKVYFSAG